MALIVALNLIILSSLNHLDLDALIDLDTGSTCLCGLPIPHSLAQLVLRAANLLMADASPLLLALLSVTALKFDLEDVTIVLKVSRSCFALAHARSFS